MASESSEPGVKQPALQLFALMPIGIGVVIAALIVQHAAYTATTYVEVLDHLMAAFLTLVAGLGLSYGVLKL